MTHTPRAMVWWIWRFYAEVDIWSVNKRHTWVWVQAPLGFFHLKMASSYGHPPVRYLVQPPFLLVKHANTIIPHEYICIYIYTLYIYNIYNIYIYIPWYTLHHHCSCLSHHFWWVSHQFYMFFGGLLKSRFLLVKPEQHCARLHRTQWHKHFQFWRTGGHGVSHGDLTNVKSRFNQRKWWYD